MNERILLGLRILTTPAIPKSIILGSGWPD